MGRRRNSTATLESGRGCPGSLLGVRWRLGQGASGMVSCVIVKQWQQSRSAATVTASSVAAAHAGDKAVVANHPSP